MVERWVQYKEYKLLCLYSRDNPTCNIKELAHCIVYDYAPAWFEIKMSSKLHEFPSLLFDDNIRLNLLPFDDVKSIIMYSIKGNAHYLLSENVLYVVMKSNDVTVRNIALSAVLTNTEKDSTSKPKCCRVDLSNWYYLATVRWATCDKAPNWWRNAVND